jgi:hypothetical protein
MRKSLLGSVLVSAALVGALAVHVQPAYAASFPVTGIFVPRNPGDFVDSRNFNATRGEVRYDPSDQAAARTRVSAYGCGGTFLTTLVWEHGQGVPKTIMNLSGPTCFRLRFINADTTWQGGAYNFDGVITYNPA